MATTSSGTETEGWTRLSGGSPEQQRLKKPEGRMQPVRLEGVSIGLVVPLGNLPFDAVNVCFHDRPRGQLPCAGLKKGKPSALKFACGQTGSHRLKKAQHTQFLREHE
ncbi:hypothetical protein TYRP_001914 [Tyrophagus putrescentiae]|nr:hypothetical protein TYRP_001914 [Tyrophagus putrescentiae]